LRRSDRWPIGRERIAFGAVSDVRRCAWADSHPLLQQYHDHEYGSHRKDDAALFELLCLESYCG
jgi:hypothetical protein